MKNKFKKSFLIIPVALFIFLAVSFCFIFKEIKQNKEIAKQAKISFEEEILRRQETKDFNNFFKSIEEEKKLFETHFVQSSGIVPFLNTIEKMAESVDTKAEVSFLEVAKDNTGLILEMKNAGSFLGVYKFLMLLENSSYELEFLSVEMHPVLDGGFEESENKIPANSNNWEAVFKIKLISFV